MAKKVRYTIDLTEEMEVEIENLALESGVAKSEIFRRAIGLLKVAHQAANDGKHVGVGRNKEALSREFVF